MDVASGLNLAPCYLIYHKMKSQFEGESLTYKQLRGTCQLAYFFLGKPIEAHAACIRSEMFCTVNLL